MTDLSKLPGLPWPLSRVAYRSTAPSAASAAAPATSAAAVSAGSTSPPAGAQVSVEVVEDRLVVAGPQLESVLATIETHVGRAAELVGCERTITGGIWGFFGREHFVVEALLPERIAAVRSAADAPAPTVATSAAPAVAAPAVAPAAAVDVAVDPAGALDGPTFADVLERALAELDDQPAYDTPTGATGTDAATDGQPSGRRRNGLRPPSPAGDEIGQDPVEGSPAVPPVPPATGATPVELLLELLAERAEQLDLEDVDPALLDRIVDEIAPAEPSDSPNGPRLEPAPVMVPFDVIAAGIGPEIAPEMAVEALVMVPFDLVAAEIGPEMAAEALVMVPFDLIAAGIGREIGAEMAVEGLVMVPFDLVAAEIGPEMAVEALVMVPFDPIAAEIAPGIAVEALVMVPFDPIVAEIGPEMAAEGLVMVPFDPIAAGIAPEVAVEATPTDRPGANTAAPGAIPTAVHSRAEMLATSAPAMPFDDLLLAVRELAGVVPRLPDDGIVAVVGDADEAIRTAELLARSTGVDPSEVVVIAPTPVLGHASRSRVQTAEHVLRHRTSRPGHGVTFVAVVLTPGVEGTDRARTTLATLRPAQTRLAAPGTSRAESVTHRLHCLAPVHAIDLVSPTDVETCAGFLDLDVPVGSIDGFTATPESWARWLRSSKPAPRARTVGRGAVRRAQTAPPAAIAAVPPETTAAASPAPTPVAPTPVAPTPAAEAAVAAAAASKQSAAASSPVSAVPPPAAAAPRPALDRSTAPSTRVAASVQPLPDIGVTPEPRPAAAAAASMPIQDIVLPDVVDLLSGAVRPLAHHTAARSRGTWGPVGTTTRRRSRLPLHTPTVDRAPLGRASTGRTPDAMSPTDRVPTDRAPTDRAPTDRAPTDRAPTDLAPTDRAPTELTLVGTGGTPDHRIVSAPAFPVVESTRRAVTAPDHRNDP